MTEFELVSLLRETASVISQDFEFFISATFAVILVSYFAGDKLSNTHRIVLLVLYLGSVSLFYLRYQNLLDQIGFITTSLRSLGSEFPGASNVPVVAWIRRLLVIFGTVAAIYLIYRPLLDLGFKPNDKNRESDT